MSPRAVELMTAREAQAALGAAWEALPDDMTGDHDTLADAVSALVRQYDNAVERYGACLQMCNEARTERDEARDLVDRAEEKWRRAEDAIRMSDQRGTDTLTAAEALDLVAQYAAGLIGTDTGGYALLVGYVDGLRARIGGAE